MKFVLKSSFFLLWSLSSLAQSEKIYKTSVDKAVVYLQGSQLYTTENVSLAQGQNTLVFEGISPYLSPNTLQASGKGNFIILDVRFETKYREVQVVKNTQKYEKAIQDVKDSLEDLTWIFKELDGKKSTLQTERTTLMNNRMMKGDFQRDSLPLLRESLNFLHERLNTITSEQLKLDRERSKYEKQRDRLNQRLAHLSNLQNNDGQPVENNPIPRVVVNILAENACAGNISINYFVASAGWVPNYEIRAAATNNQMQLKHFADVYQNTGLEWNNVNLTLSTGNPTQGNVKPELNPWILAYYNPATRKYQHQLNEATVATRSKAAGAVDSKKESNNYAPDDYEDLPDAQSAGDYTIVNDNILRVEYEIKLKYSIASDNKAHKVVVQSKEIPTEYRFSAVPKLDQDAFLMARVTGWEEMNLIPGKARLFFDGTYTGETFLNAAVTTDTLDLNLGRDKGIVIKRVKLKDKSKEKVIGEERTQTVAYEITIRNTKNIPILMEVQDQIPVANGHSQGLKVELLEKDKATYNDITGKLTWNLKLGSKETAKLRFTYEIKYPKDKVIAGL